MVSCSNSEAEYRVLVVLICKVQWLHYLFKDLGVQFNKHASIYYHNRYVIYLAHNSIFHERSKYIKIDCHLICEKQESGLIKLFSISSSAQLANVLTKPLVTPVFPSFLSKLWNRLWLCVFFFLKLFSVHIHSPSYRGVLETVIILFSVIMLCYFRLLCW